MFRDLIARLSVPEWRCEAGDEVRQAGRADAPLARSLGRVDEGWPAVSDTASEIA